MTPQELRDLVDDLRAESKAAEAAFDDAQAQLYPAEAALASLDKTGYTVYGGEAIWETPPVKLPPSEYVPFENEVPQKLAKKATEVGLRNFFSAKKGE